MQYIAITVQDVAVRQRNAIAVEYEPTFNLGLFFKLLKMSEKVYFKSHILERPS